MVNNLVHSPLKPKIQIERRNFIFKPFFNALEAHESLLHAETQAIAAQHIDTIESIIAQKEESLKSLLEAKSDIGFDPRENHEADLLIDRVIELQKEMLIHSENCIKNNHQKILILRKQNQNHWIVE